MRTNLSSAPPRVGDAAPPAARRGTTDVGARVCAAGRRRAARRPRRAGRARRRPVCVFISPTTAATKSSRGDIAFADDAVPLAQAAASGCGVRAAARLGQGPSPCSTSTTLRFATSARRKEAKNAAGPSAAPPPSTSALTRRPPHERLNAGGAQSDIVGVGRRRHVSGRADAPRRARRSSRARDTLCAQRFAQAFERTANATRRALRAIAVRAARATGGDCQSVRDGARVNDGLAQRRRLER